MNADMLEISQSVSDILNDALTPEEIDEFSTSMHLGRPRI